VDRLGFGEGGGYSLIRLSAFGLPLSFFARAEVVLKEDVCCCTAASTDGRTAALAVSLMGIENTLARVEESEKWGMAIRLVGSRVLALP
jgi:hypothetical protein